MSSQVPFLLAPLHLVGCRPQRRGSERSPPAQRRWRTGKIEGDQRSLPEGQRWYSGHLRITVITETSRWVCERNDTWSHTMSAFRMRDWKGNIWHTTMRSQKTKSVAESTARSLRLTPSWHNSTRIWQGDITGHDERSHLEQQKNSRWHLLCLPMWLQTGRDLHRTRWGSSSGKACPQLDRNLLLTWVPGPRWPPGTTEMSQAEETNVRVDTERLWSCSSETEPCLKDGLDTCGALPNPVVSGLAGFITCLHM